MKEEIILTEENVVDIYKKLCAKKYIPPVERKEVEIRFLDLLYETIKD